MVVSHAEREVAGTWLTELIFFDITDKRELIWAGSLFAVFESNQMSGASHDVADWANIF
jgi:hypothetical protein